MSRNSRSGAGTSAEVEQTGVENSATRAVRARARRGQRPPLPVEDGVGEDVGRAAGASANASVSVSAKQRARRQGRVFGQRGDAAAESSAARQRRMVDVQALIRSQFMRDLPLIFVGCAIAAFATDAFMIPNGLAAGGLTGLATITSELAARNGFSLPVGIQTIVMNALLLFAVVRAGGVRYVVQTVTGFVALGFFMDLFSPFVIPLHADDLMLSALWGGIISGVGYGIVFRCGANTGGSDTIAQIISRRTSLAVGSTVMAIDVAICVASAPVFSLENALYAGLSMVLSGFVIDAVVDGGNRQRAAFIVSDAYADIEQQIFSEMDRGCTELLARGAWTRRDRPVVLLIMTVSEVRILKTIVSECDPDALVMITDVNEAIGYGFKDLEA